MDLREEIIGLLSRRWEGLTSEDILRALNSNGLLHDYMRGRYVLAELVREGVIEKVPISEKMKFVFRLRTKP